MAFLVLRNIRKKFGSLTVIPDLNLEIEAGEFVALVGPSGCGKSTLLRTIAGLEEIDSGEIWVEGRQIDDLGPKDRNIAMVFQSYALYPHKTVRDNMGFSLKLAKRPKEEIEQRVGEASRMLHLDALLDRKPGQLSGGQRQRVAMGRAIVRRPKVFLFDEPLSNLDAKLRVAMRAEIKLLHQTVRTTSVYVTHDQIEAMTLADRLVVLNKGVIEQQGTPLELYSNPCNMFVAGFIGSPAMNFLPADIVEENGQKLATLAGGTRLPLPAELLRDAKTSASHPRSAAGAPDHAGRRPAFGLDHHDRADRRPDPGLFRCRRNAGHRLGRWGYAAACRRPVCLQRQSRPNPPIRQRHGQQDLGRGRAIACDVAEQQRNESIAATPTRPAPWWRASQARRRPPASGR